MKIRCISILAAGLLIFAGCCGNQAGGRHDDEREAGSTEGHHHEEEGVIRFSDAQAEAAGLKTETVTPGRFSTVIRTGGEILPAQGDVRTVVSTTSGIISLGGGGTKILPGIKVSAGTSIATISAREMAEGDPVAKSRAAYVAAKKEFDRASELHKTGAISQKAYEQAELQYNTAKSEYDAYNGKSGDKGLSLSSPLSGYIQQLYVADGDYVSAGQAVAVVCQNRRLQLQADLPEKYYAYAAHFTDANFRPSYGDKTYNVKELSGRMVSAGRVSSEDSFYLPVIFEFNNSGDFVPGSYCDIYLIAGQRDEVISVPESALTEEQGVYYVYRHIHEDEYMKQEVKIGETDGVRREILKGLKTGDEVVTEGAYQVKLASVSAVPEGHAHNH